jgi:FKBP-type peptidyl-prolyl cis-trans isomerase SlyD
MKIERDRVVAIDYTLRGDDGEVIESSEQHAPLYYLHGHDNIVPGLEDELDGKQEGDSLEVAVPPERGYGAWDEKNVFDVPKNQLPPDVTPQKGMDLHMTTNDGRRRAVRIKAVRINSVLVDGNHDLAGKTLHFKVTVRSVRKATKDELSHGHAHGPGGHHH